MVSVLLFLSVLGRLENTPCFVCAVCVLGEGALQHPAAPSSSFASSRVCLNGIVQASARASVTAMKPILPTHGSCVLFNYADLFLHPKNSLAGTRLLFQHVQPLIEEVTLHLVLFRAKVVSLPHLTTSHRFASRSRRVKRAARESELSRRPSGSCSKSEHIVSVQSSAH